MRGIVGSIRWEDSADAWLDEGRLAARGRLKDMSAVVLHRYGLVLFLPLACRQAACTPRAKEGAGDFDLHREVDLLLARMLLEELHWQLFHDLRWRHGRVRPAAGGGGGQPQAQECPCSVEVSDQVTAVLFCAVP